MDSYASGVAQGRLYRYDCYMCGKSIFRCVAWLERGLCDQCMGGQIAEARRLVRLGYKM